VDGDDAGRRRWADDSVGPIAWNVTVGELEAGHVNPLVAFARPGVEAESPGEVIASGGGSVVHRVLHQYTVRRCRVYV
jgi:hypothetical protein